MIKQQTATDIALIYREIKASEDLLAEIEQAQATFSQKDIRDVFGRVQGNIEVGVPNGDRSINFTPKTIIFWQIIQKL